MRGLETYSLLIDTYVKDEAVEFIPPASGKANKNGIGIII